MKRLTLTLTLAVLGMSHTPVMGANSTWTGPSGTQEWSATANWTGGVVPGANTGTTDASTATFNQATAGTSVTVDPGRNIKNITFDTAAGTYTIGNAGANAGNALLLTSAGAITVNSGVTGTNIAETFNASLVLEGLTTSSGTSTYSFTNNAVNGSGDTLNFAGSISGGNTSTGTLNLNGTNVGSINNISGAISNGTSTGLSIVLGGNTTWELSGNNSGMTGGTVTVGGVGTLLIGNNNALGTESVVFNGTGVTSFGAVGNVTVGNNFLNGSTTFAATYVGSGNLTITGTYASTLVSNVNFNNFGTGSLNLAGDFYLNSTTGSGKIFQMRNFGNTKFSGNILNSTAGGTGAVFVSMGSGTLTLDANYAATGNLWDYGGTLVVDTTASTARLPNAQLSLAGVTLDLSGAGGGNQAVASTLFHLGETTIQETNSSTARLNLGTISKNAGSAVNFGTNAASTSTANSSGILGASYVYNGTDWAVGNGAATAISGYSAYTTYTGAATTSTGNYLLTGSGTIGSSMTQNTFKLISSGAGQALTIASGATDVTNGILYTGSDAYAIDGGGSLTATSALYIQQWGAGALTISAAITDNGTPTSLTKAGTGLLVLSGTNTYSGATYVVSGTLSVSSDANLGGLNTVSVLSSSTGTSTVIVSGTVPTSLVEGSSFMGTTVFSASGTLVTLNGPANQTITGTTSVGFISALALDGSTLAVTNSFNMSETIAGQTVNRSIELGANGGTLDVANGQTLTVAGIVGNAVNQDFFPGTAWTPFGALTKAGQGTLMLSGTNSYSGGTNINAGTVEFGSIVSMPSTGAVTVNNGGTLAIAVGGAGQFTNATSGAGSIGGIFSGVGGQGASTVTLNSGSSVGIDTTGGSVTYAGNITNAGVGLTKLGTNSLNLSGNNTYTGPTLVSSGTLIVSNTSGSATGTGALTVKNGATLMGTGTIHSSSNTINGSVLVGNGGTTDVLTMTASSATTFSGASLTFNLDSASTNSSQLALGSTASVVFGGGTTLTLNLVGSTPITTATDYLLFSSTATTDVFSGLTVDGNNVITGGLNFTITGANAANYAGSYLMLFSNGVGGDDIVLVVPEPGTWVLMLGGLAILVIFQRSRRTSQQATSSRNKQA